MPEAKRHRNQRRFFAQVQRNHFEQRSVGVDARPAQLVANQGLGVLYHPGDRVSNVLT